MKGQNPSSKQHVPTYKSNMFYPDLQGYLNKLIIPEVYSLGSRFPSQFLEHLPVKLVHLKLQVLLVLIENLLQEKAAFH